VGKSRSLSKCFHNRSRRCLDSFLHFPIIMDAVNLILSSQKNPAGSGYSKGPRKLPDPERPPQPGTTFASVSSSCFFIFNLSPQHRVMLNLTVIFSANPIFEPEKCKAYIAYTCKMCVLNNKVRYIVSFVFW
jgi:hypothetical protein